MRAHQHDYQLPAHAKAWYDRVFSQPGFYVVTSAPNMGKSALLRHLAVEFQHKCEAETKLTVIDFSFRRGGHERWSSAVAHIYHEVVSVIPATLLPGDQYRPPDLPSEWFMHWDWLDQDWFSLDKNKPEGEQAVKTCIVILIDNLQAMHRSDYNRLDDLLPTQRMRNTRLILAGQLDLNKQCSHLAYQPDMTLELKHFSFDDTKDLADHFNLGHPYNRIAEEVQNRTAGHPYLVSALCWELQRSNDPLATLKHIPQPTQITQLAEYQLETMEDRIDQYVIVRPYLHTRLPQLLRRILGVLAVAPTPLPFDDLRQLLDCDWDELNALHYLLRQHIVDANGQFQLVSFILGDYLRQMAVNGQRYALVVREALSQVPAWFYQRYATQDTEPQALPLYILRQAARFSIAVGHVEEVFINRAWKLALEQRDSLQAVREAVREAREAVEYTASPEGRVLGVTVCAVMATSLVAVLPPEVVALLVRCGLWTEARAHDYARGYAAVRDYHLLKLLLGQPEQEPLAGRYEELPQQLILVTGFSIQEQAYYLQQVLQPYEVIGRGKADMVIDALRATPSVAEEPQGHSSALSMPKLIEILEGLSFHSHPANTAGGDEDQLSNEQINLLDTIERSWRREEPVAFSANRYVDLTRLLSNSTRANYFEALSILAPAISRVFGTACACRLATMIERITEVYP